MAARQDAITHTQAMRHLKGAVELLGKVTEDVNNMTAAVANTTPEDNKSLGIRLRKLVRFTDEGGVITGSQAIPLTAQVSKLTSAIEKNERQILATSMPTSVDSDSLRANVHKLEAKISERNPTELGALSDELRKLANKLSAIDFVKFERDLSELTSAIKNGEWDKVSTDGVNAILKRAVLLKDSLDLDEGTIDKIDNLKEAFNSAYDSDDAKKNLNKRDITLSLTLGELKKAIDRLVDGIEEAKFLVVDLGIKLVNLSNGILVSEPDPSKSNERTNSCGTTLCKEIEELREDLNKLINELTNHPPGSDRFKIEDLGWLEAQLIDLHLAVGTILYREDPVLNHEEGITLKDIKTSEIISFKEQFKDNLEGKLKASDVIIERLHTLNESMHNLVSILYKQYPAVIMHGGVERLGMNELAKSLNLSTEEHFKNFDPVKTLKWCHAYGWLKIRDLKAAEDKIEFTFSGPGQNTERTVGGSTPTKPVRNSAIWGATIAAPATALSLLSLGVPTPEAAVTLALFSLTGGAIASALLAVKSRSGISSRFRITVDRDAKGNAFHAEDVLAKTIVVCQTMSGIARKVGSLEPFADKNDEIAQRTANPYLALVSQSIKALSLATTGYSRMIGQTTLEANSARTNVEEALNKLLDVEKKTVTAWMRGMIFPALIAGGTGTVGLLGSFGKIVEYAGLLFGF